VNADLGRLAPGRHTLTVWRYLNYRLPQRDPQTGETVWEHRTMALAKGELPVTVQP
jgi:hypothetical protein